jgi:hypothetical protein
VLAREPGSRAGCSSGGFVVIPTPSTMRRRTVKRPRSDTHGKLREDFLRAVWHLRIGRHQAQALVEACSGRPFGVCGPAELLPILDELLAVARRAGRVADEQ